MMKTPVVVLSLSLTILSFGDAYAATIFFKNNCANDTPVPWNGRFWARTGCSTDVSGKFICATADCASGQVTCNGNVAIPPATLAEFNIPTGRGGTGECKTASCPANVNAVCPSDLQKKGSDGSVVACLSACVKLNQPQYCCTPPQNTPETCPPTNYSQIFSQACPNAYSYAYDDKKGTFTCNSGPNYAITFCP
ncbi:hypothetical protein L3X38_040744 [Prunus dulcis]|uniref:Pathogenesis-related thaumatin superfamily protein n=1 Tax=Prunus dulcis TaxID=3755 RepID=A0AAD4URF3_PRUDU|nr:hypothetical protein L3X38_040744 [Prunus dulcis]